MPLTDARCRKAKPKSKPYKLGDGYGLYLEITPNGGKYWRKKYYFGGNERRHTIGTYGEGRVSLSDARKEAVHISELVKKGIDPAQAKRALKREQVEKHSNTFQAVAEEWHETQRDSWCPKHAEVVMNRFKNDVFPYIGNRPIAEITTSELRKEVLKRMEARNVLDLAKRVRLYCEHVFDYAIASELMDNNPAYNARKLLKKPEAKNFPVIPFKELPDLLKAVNTKRLSYLPTTLNAFTLMSLVFLRTGELRNGRWEEIDWEKKQWIIPPERMKSKRGHIVPLSRQALAILEAQKEIAGDSALIFPNQKHPKKPMSENTILTVLEKAGYKGKMVGHGFRALAMTAIREELGYPYEIPDIQLAHGKRDKLKQAYDKSQFMSERTEMMQKWADLVEACGDITPAKLIAHD